MIKFILIVGLIVFIGLFMKSRDDYRKQLTSLRNGDIKSVVDGHKSVIFEHIDGSLFTINRFPFLLFTDGINVEIAKCGNPCKKTGFWQE